jgi:hypothetical protein
VQESIVLEAARGAVYAARDRVTEITGKAVDDSGRAVGQVLYLVEQAGLRRAPTSRLTGRSAGAALVAADTSPGDIMTPEGPRGGERSSSPT